MASKIEEIYSAGYAILLYDIVNDKRTYYFRDEEFTVSAEHAPYWDSDNKWKLAVSKIESVRRAADASKP